MRKDETICFIIPPSVFLLDERVFMSLGILKVAAAIEKNHRIEVLDLSGIANFEDAVRDYLIASKASIFGLTVTTPQLPAVTSLIRVIRKHRPSSKIIIGGPHATLVHAAYRKEKKENIISRATHSFLKLADMVDVVVAGDGEKAITEALKKQTPKIIDGDNPNSRFFLKNPDLDELPWPARHLVDVSTYRYFIDGERALSLISQLGCPFACGFCGGRNSPSLRVARTRSVGNIVNEMAYLHKTYDIKGFMFYDDELNVNKRLVVELMNEVVRLQERLGVEFRLRGFVKSELFNDEQASSMYRAGFRWILVGFESGSPRMLRNMNKKSTVEKNTRCIEIAKKYGLKVKALMSLGHPGESEETAMKTHEWLLDIRPDDFDVAIITVYPGTPYYDEAIPHSTKNGIWVYCSNGNNLYSEEIDYHTVANYYKGNPDGGYTSFVYTDFLNQDSIVRLRDYIERDVRLKLSIPFNPGSPVRHYDHSMGQNGKFPQFILKQRA